MSDEILFMFIDVEMLEMDGYCFIVEVRSDLRMFDFFIVLNMLFSGSFNDVMVEKVGCNWFIFKF